ncbi:hypothetical protein AVEN_115309-1 [Araneus ventricosus]|uniref:Uncharacterized protein n=1 Tax=Araneus ventricosus TaxID=182803 RepID=A0A4Y1ZY24_ARAVE|nr:hypothetical protein AVEN_115309-1 [Araneus ventricosus]
MLGNLPLKGRSTQSHSAHMKGMLSFVALSDCVDSFITMQMRSFKESMMEHPPAGYGKWFLFTSSFTISGSKEEKESIPFSFHPKDCIRMLSKMVFGRFNQLFWDVSFQGRRKARGKISDTREETGTYDGR